MQKFVQDIDDIRNFNLINKKILKHFSYISSHKIYRVPNKNQLSFILQIHKIIISIATLVITLVSFIIIKR